MTELSESFEEPEIQGIELYQIKEGLYDDLQDLTARAEDLTRRESFWRRNGLNIALSPLATASVLMVSPIGEMMSDNEKAGVGTSGLIATLCLGMLALHKHDKNREKAQTLAEDAKPIAHDLNGGTLPWIEQRLRQKIEDKE